MEENAERGEFENFFGPLATGICAAENWLLLEANEPLRTLLHLQDMLPSHALEEWLQRHNITVLSSSDDTGMAGQALLHDPKGRLLYASWKPDGDGRRRIVILPLPLGNIRYPVPTPMTHVESEEIWTSALEYINDGIWIIDGNGITRYINKALEFIAGIKAEDVVGKHVTQLLSMVNAE